MDDVRSQFSSHISSLIQLNDSLLGKVKDLEKDLEDRRKRHEATKQLLVKNLTKSTRLSRECEGASNETEKYKEQIKLIVAKTKEKEAEWVKYAKSCQIFKSGCTCQNRKAKSKILTEPSEFVFEEVTLQNDELVFPVPGDIDLSWGAQVSHKNLAKSSPVGNSAILSSQLNSTVDTPKLSSTRNTSKRLRRLSPVAKKKIRYDNITVYADDSQDSPEILHLLNKSHLSQNQSCTDAKPIERGKSDVPQYAPNNEQFSTVILEPVSPVLSLESKSPVIDLKDTGSPVVVDLSEGCESWSTLEMFAAETPVFAKSARKLNIMNEFKGDISINEEKLGFSLPTSGDTECLTNPMSGDNPLVEEKKSAPTVTIPTAPKDFKFEAVVRNKEDRLRMKGRDCPLCYRYYEACGLSPEEIKKLIGDLSRHRHMHDKRSDTPPGFWDMTIAAGMATQPATQKKVKKKNKYARKHE